MSKKRSGIAPRIIIHGGAGNITRSNLPPHLWHQHRSSLLSILRSTSSLLNKPGTTALDAAVHAVQLFEENPLYNAGKGAVFNRAGHVELEASVMVSQGKIKRGVGVSLLQHVKSPITLARELLIRGDEENGGGGQGHCQLSGPCVEELAKSWGLEMVEETYFWTKKRWDEHKRGLEKDPVLAKTTTAILDSDESELSWPADEVGWDSKEYLPQGTVGCVVLDSAGCLCVATSTGGLTNKLPGRIGDTPTLGAGYWSETWHRAAAPSPNINKQPSLYSMVLQSIQGLELGDVLRDCLPLQLSTYQSVEQEKSSAISIAEDEEQHPSSNLQTHAVAMSGTGNGDSFLRLNALRTAAALTRFASHPSVSLPAAVKWMAGRGGELQRSAGTRWGLTGEGEGGIIGIERNGERSNIVWDFNCGGMFRAWLDENGDERCMVFHEDYDEYGQ